MRTYHDHFGRPASNVAIEHSVDSISREVDVGKSMALTLYNVNNEHYQWFWEVYTHGVNVVIVITRAASESVSVRMEVKLVKRCPLHSMVTGVTRLRDLWSRWNPHAIDIDPRLGYRRPQGDGLLYQLTLNRGDAGTFPKTSEARVAITWTLSWNLNHENEEDYLNSCMVGPEMCRIG